MVEFQDGGVNVAKTVSFPVSFPLEGGFVLHSFSSEKPRTTARGIRASQEYKVQQQWRIMWMNY